MKHPNEGYMGKWELGTFACNFENKEIVVAPIYTYKPMEVIGFKSLNCGCSWPCNNLEYLEYCYERNHV